MNPSEVLRQSFWNHFREAFLTPLWWLRFWIGMRTDADSIAPTEAEE